MTTVYGYFIKYRIPSNKHLRLFREIWNVFGLLTLFLLNCYLFIFEENVIVYTF